MMTRRLLAALPRPSPACPSPILCLGLVPLQLRHASVSTADSSSSSSSSERDAARAAVAARVESRLAAASASRAAVRLRRRVINGSLAVLLVGFVSWSYQHSIQTVRTAADALTAPTIAEIERELDSEAEGDGQQLQAPRDDGGAQTGGSSGGK